MPHVQAGAGGGCAGLAAQVASSQAPSRGPRRAASARRRAAPRPARPLDEPRPQPEDRPEDERRVAHAAAPAPSAGPPTHRRLGPARPSPRRGRGPGAGPPDADVSATGAGASACRMVLLDAHDARRAERFAPAVLRPGHRRQADTLAPMAVAARARRPTRPPGLGPGVGAGGRGTPRGGRGRGRAWARRRCCTCCAGARRGRRHARPARPRRRARAGVRLRHRAPALRAAADDGRRPTSAPTCSPGAAGLAAERLGFAGTAPAAEPDGGGAPDAAFAVLHGLYWLCANLAARRPLVLVGRRRPLGRRRPPCASSCSSQTRLEELPVALVVATRPELPRRRARRAARARRGAGGDAAPAAAAVGRRRSRRSSRPALGEAAGRRLHRRLPAGDARHAVPRPPARSSALHEERVRPVARSAPRVEHHGARTVARWILVRLDRLPAGGRAPGPRRRRARAGRAARAAAALAGLDPREAAEAADELEAARHPRARAAAELRPPDRARRRLRRAVRRRARRGPPPRRRAARRRSRRPPSAPRSTCWPRSRRATRGWWTGSPPRPRVAVAGGAPESAVTYLRRALQEPPAPGGARARGCSSSALAEVSAGLPGAEAAPPRGARRAARRRRTS